VPSHLTAPPRLGPRTKRESFDRIAVDRWMWLLPGLGPAAEVSYGRAQDSFFFGKSGQNHVGRAMPPRLRGGKLFGCTARFTDTGGDCLLFSMMSSQLVSGECLAHINHSAAFSSIAQYGDCAAWPKAWENLGLVSRLLPCARCSFRMFDQLQHPHTFSRLTKTTGLSSRGTLNAQGWFFSISPSWPCDFPGYSPWCFFPSCISPP